MKRFFAVLFLLGIGIVSVEKADAAYCYECKSGGACMDCWHPVSDGHVSCIPYCNGTCLVGAECSVTFRVMELAPDGTVLVADTPADGSSAEKVSRNCMGMIVHRAYEESVVASIRGRTSVIVL